jgi:FPC/CPF motif-containing protein YcgG
MVGQVLDTQAMQGLQQDFARFEHEEMDAAKRASLLKSLQHLEARFTATAKK